MVIIFRDCKYVIVHYSNFTLLQFWNVNPNRLTYSYFRKGYQLVIECSTERDYEKKQLREIMKNSIFLFFSNIETIFSEMPVFSSDQIKCLMHTRHLLWLTQGKKQQRNMLCCYATSVHQTFTKKMICVVPENNIHTTPPSPHGRDWKF